jgi:hypothetical protein
MIVDEVLAAFQRGRDRGERIPRDFVLAAMASDSLDVQAALYDHIMQSRFARLIDPPLELSDYLTFVPDFTRRCMQRNFSNEWVPERHLIGHDFRKWFESLFEDKDIPRDISVRLKEWLAQFYRESDAELRLAIVNAILEHLFENRRIRRFFSDWKTDPLLSQAYAEAEMWIRGLP